MVACSIVSNNTNSISWTEWNSGQLISPIKFELSNFMIYRNCLYVRYFFFHYIFYDMLLLGKALTTGYVPYWAIMSLQRLCSRKFSMVSRISGTMHCWGGGCLANFAIRKTIIQKDVHSALIFKTLLTLLLFYARSIIWNDRQCKSYKPFYLRQSKKANIYYRQHWR